MDTLEKKMSNPNEDDATPSPSKEQSKLQSDSTEKSINVSGKKSVQNFSSLSVF